MYSCAMSSAVSPPLVADPFESLSEQQREAVRHGSDGDTRALLAPQRFFVSEQARHGDRHVYASLSRFITDKAAACFERVSAQRPPGAEGAPGPAAVPDVKIDLAARLRDRWTPRQ